jgi:putative ABC transport system substrate-binding protein
LRELGWVEGQTITIEYRWAEGRIERFAEIAAEFVRLDVDIIVAAGTGPVLAAKQASSRVPVVFPIAIDPVAAGAKRLELLRQLVPRATTIAMLVNPNSEVTEAERRDVQAAAQAVGQELVILDVGSDRDIEIAFATFVQRGSGAVHVGTGPFMNSNRKKIVAQAARHALPTSHGEREGATAGGLMSYGSSIADAYRQAGIYAARILNGEKPADLPVMQSTRFELVLNLRTAKALGVDVPDRMLALADEVIE